MGRTSPRFIHFLKSQFSATPLGVKVGIFVCLAFLFWITRSLVFAEREAKIHVFPSAVSQVGWKNESSSLQQDLSPSAMGNYFSESNSASIVFSANEGVVTPEESFKDETVGLDELLAPIPPPLPSEEVVASTSNTRLDTESESLVPVRNDTGQSGDASSTSSLDALPSEGVGDMLVPPLPEVAPTSESPSLIQSLQNLVAPLFSTPNASAQVQNGIGNESDATTTESDAGVPTINDLGNTAICTTLGKPCHTLEYTGFGVGSVLEGHTIKNLQLRVSLATFSSAGVGDDDRISITYFSDGKWYVADTLTLDRSFANGDNGGYFLYALPPTLSWDSLNEFRVRIEYDRKGTKASGAYIDGVWLDVAYDGDELASSTPSFVGNIKRDLDFRNALEEEGRDTLYLEDGSAVRFTHTDESAGEDLLIKTDGAEYVGLATSKIHFSVTNTSGDDVVFRPQFYFPKSGGKITSLSKWMQNIPFDVKTPEYRTTAFLCDAGWVLASTSTDAQDRGLYQCTSTEETRMCDSLNSEGNNCIANGERVGVVTDRRFRDGWRSTVLSDSSLEENQGVLERVIRLFSGRDGKEKPADFAVVASSVEGEVVAPGQTLYFESVITFPKNSSGGFAIEAVGDGTAYGLVRADWNAVWKYRIPVTIRNPNTETELPAGATYLQIPDLPREFWDEVRQDGGDVRFVGIDGTTELPYFLTEWNATSSRISAWVNTPMVSPQDDETIWLYYGNALAVSSSDLYAPFASTLMRPLFRIFGTQQNQFTVDVISLVDGNLVQLDDFDPVHLGRKESVSLSSLKLLSTLSATGPISAKLRGSHSHRVLVPTSFAGTEIGIPGSLTRLHTSMILPSSEGTLSFQVRENEQGEVAEGSPDVTLSRELSLGSSMIVKASSTNVLSAVFASDGAYASAVYPATTEDLYGVMLSEQTTTVVGNGASVGTFCTNGGRADVAGRRSGAMVQNALCSGSPVGWGEGVRVASRVAPVSALSVRYTENASALPFLPEREFSVEYLLPDIAMELAVVCPTDRDPLSVGLFDEEDRLLRTVTCEGNRQGAPGLAIIDGVPGGMNAGYRVASREYPPRPFALYASSIKVTDHVPDGEFYQVWGATQSRAGGNWEQEVSLGIPERNLVFQSDALVFNEAEKVHINELLYDKRQFKISENPKFLFRYIPQANALLRTVGSLFTKRTFEVTKVSIVHDALGELPVGVDVLYGDGNDWSIRLKDGDRSLRPGRYTLHVEIQEGLSTYVDDVTFYWGVLAQNFNKSVYAPGENAVISVAALSNTGSTICDAQLVLSVTDPTGTTTDVKVSPSGECNGNNFTDIPDYIGVYQTSGVGRYQMTIYRLNEAGLIVNQTQDSFLVRESDPISVERIGSTRINPTGKYGMTLRLKATQEFEGSIEERIPEDWVVIDRGNMWLSTTTASGTIAGTWNVHLLAGESLDLTYRYDAPDLSPYLFLLGPATLKSATGTEVFQESRAWQVASDAVGKMYILWDNNSYVPAGWTCVSCSGGNTFFQKFAMGSTSYDGLGYGSTTHSHLASSTVETTLSAGVTEQSATAPLNVSSVGHSHSLSATTSYASNLPLYRQLRVLQNNSAGDPTSLPAGAILIFDATVPSGWTRYSAQDGYYVRGENTAGSTGGSNVHTHTIGGTLTAPPETGNRQRTGGTQVSTALTTHTHLVSTTTPSASSEPPYIEVILGKLDATSSPPNNIIAMWDNTPDAGWTNLSGVGGAFNGRFLKATTTYGGTGGGSSHTLSDISGAVSGSAVTVGNARQTGTLVGSPAAHNHLVNFSNFTTDAHLPPYVDVVYAKRYVGYSLYTQNIYQWYSNANSATPIDPWPAGGSDVGENTVIDTATTPSSPAGVLRLRLSVTANNATSTVGRDRFKLQYSAASSGSCATSLNWTDVAPTGSTTALWRGYDNAGVVNNSTIPSSLLSMSSSSESYVEQNNATGTPTQIDLGTDGEWDWAIQHHTAIQNTNYCFRMTFDDGTPFDVYANYPEVLTNSAPQSAVQVTLFDNEKTGSTSPKFTFYSLDIEDNDLDYEIQLSASTTFASTILDSDSTLNPELFDNVTAPTNKAPFLSGDTISFVSTSVLTNGSTYWWRVRAKDTNGSGEWGAWSAGRSFTVDTAVVYSTWHQTTLDQWGTDTFVLTATSSPGDVILSSASPGNLYSTPIDFSSATLGTTWNQLSWNDNETNGNVKYQLEY